MPLGALIGSVGGGAIIELLGRKTTILATTLPFIVSWLLIALAQHIYMLYIARTIQGICVGIASLCLPVYLAETVQPEVRGTLGLLPTTIGNSGLLICFVAGMFLNWQHLAYLCAALSLPFLVLMFFIPETPRWYIAHGKEEQAEKALQWLRGSETDIRAELSAIKNTQLQSQKQAATLKDLMGKAYVKPLLTSLGLMLFQQFSGINAVIFYTVFIFDISGSSLDSNICTIIVGVVNFGSTFMANVLIDKLGRKVLLIISDVFMIISLALLGVFFYMKEHHTEVTVEYGWVPLGSFMLFVVAFSLGFGPIPWLMLGELFPGKIRGSAAAASTAFNWICAFIVTKAFPELIANFGPYVTFLTFGVICFVGLFFIIFVVPETRGRSLDDIERNLTKPFRRLSSTANLKPSPMSM
jgi:facilitated trehalose transporter